MHTRSTKREIHNFPYVTIIDYQCTDKTDLTIISQCRYLPDEKWVMIIYLNNYSVILRKRETANMFFSELCNRNNSNKTSTHSKLAIAPYRRFKQYYIL